MKNSASPITPGMSFNLTNEELFELQKTAEKGDAQASQKLWLFYKFTIRDQAKALQWLEKAAEQGLPSAQYSLGFELSRRGSPRYDIKTAVYWTTMAANNGEELAHRLLNEIKQLDDQGGACSRARLR